MNRPLCLCPVDCTLHFGLKPGKTNGREKFGVKQLNIKRIVGRLADPR